MTSSSSSRRSANPRTLPNGYRLHHIITSASVAPVTQYDDSRGLFGELLEPTLILEGLKVSDHAGKIDDPHLASATQAMHSFRCNTEDENQHAYIEFANETPYPVILRWMDERGTCFPQYTWTIDRFSSKIQFAHLGHLFLLCIRRQQKSQEEGDVSGGGGEKEEEEEEEEEQLLGAYRVRMCLPSGSAHYVLIEQDPTTSTEEFVMENRLVDPSGKDDMVLACASLDPVSVNATKTEVVTRNLTKTIKTLHTVVSNLQKDPHEPKFRSLRLSNSTVQKTIGNSLGAQHLLYGIGFRSDILEDHLVLPVETNEQQLLLENTIHDNNDKQQQRLDQAHELLQQLVTRNQPGFVPELAASKPPWIPPVLNSTLTNATSFGSPRNDWITDDEKWKRAMMRRGRRSSARTPPTLGNAPSSNGPWGR